MNNNENNIGGSSSGQENGDSKSKQDRPLKKARFAWQVKGRHHLKTDNNKNNNNGPSTARHDAHVKDRVPQETKYPQAQMKINFSPFNITDFKMMKSLEPLAAQPEIYCNKCNGVTSYNTSRTCCLCTANTFNNNSIPTAIKRRFKDELPLQEWQALQESKCLLDNLVNKVLDTWTSNPLMGDYGSERRTNNVGNNEVVNEGILMAISAHGLQNASNSVRNINMPVLNTMEVVASATDCYDEISPSSTRRQTHNVTEQLSTTCCLQEEDYVTDKYNSSINCDNIMENDFLDAAIEFTIQNKGLTSSANEFG